MFPGIVSLNYGHSDAILRGIGRIVRKADSRLVWGLFAALSRGSFPVIGHAHSPTLNSTTKAIMMKNPAIRFPVAITVATLSLLLTASLHAQEPATADASGPLATGKLRSARVSGEGPGWRALGGQDFVNVNCDADTWAWKAGHAFCTGKPVGVIRSQEPLKNFELVCEWMHKRKGGNSGVFVWASPQSIDQLAKGKGRLPHGIEVQVLDLGYEQVYLAGGKNRVANWFTSHGDVFPTGPAKMKPFPPVAPDGKRSFPSKDLTKDLLQWNHYYIRAINGEVRLWVNGEEVSGGTNCEPATGYLCLESEGSPVEFRNLRIRELP